MPEGRKVLTAEEFQNYKNRIDVLNGLRATNAQVAYALILLRDRGVDLVRLLNDIGEDLSSEDELIQEELEDGNDITIPPDIFLESVPEKYRGIFDEVERIVTEFIASEDKSANLFDEIEEIEVDDTEVDQDILEICSEISEYDLSQVPPEMFYDFRNIKNINFEGTGAKLDMANIRAGMVMGSIKGCELISFDADRYSNRRVITEEECDIEQYQAILDYFNTDENIRLFSFFKYGFILQIPEIQSSNSNFFRRFYEAHKDDPLDNSIGYMWEIMTAEAQSQNLEYFNMDLVGPYYLISNTKDLELRKSKIPEVIEYYKTTGQQSWASEANNFVKHIFRTLTEEEQRELYHDMEELCVGVESYLQGKFRKYEAFWSELKPALKEEYALHAITTYCTEDEVLDANKATMLLQDMNISDEVIEYCIGKYSQGKATNFRSLWEILDKDKQADNIAEVISVDFKEFEKLWTSTNDEVKAKKKDEVAQVILNQLKPEAIEKSIKKEEIGVPSNLALALKLAQSDEFKIDIPEETIGYVLDQYSKNEGSFQTERWQKVYSLLSKENKEKYFTQFLTANKSNASEIWKKTELDTKIKKFDELDAIDFETSSHMKNEITKIYIDVLKNMSPEERRTKIDKSRFFDSLRARCGLEPDASFNEKYKDYKIEDIESLLKLEISRTNIDTVVKAIPILGEEVIARTYESNSEMMAGYADQIINALCEKAVTTNKQEALRMLDKIDDVFSKDYLPSFYKIYKYFDVVVNQNDAIFKKMDVSKRLSPVLQNAKSNSLRKRIIFSDLMKISMDSNNKSFRDFLETLEDGNKIYVDIMKNGTKFEDLSPKEKQVFTDFTGVLQALYQESGTYSRAEREGRSLILTGDVVKDAESLGKRYSADGKIEDLPDRVLKTYIGPYQELFDGITTVAQMREYVDNKTKESNEHHREVASKKFDLQTGDLVKGIQGFNMEILKSILQDGVRAGEFLGTSNHSDLTPLDTDFGIYVDSADLKDKSLSEKIKSTPAGNYSNVYIVLKNDSSRREYTRVNEDTSPDVKVEEETSATRIADKNKPKEAKKRNDARTTGEYQTSKYEVFNSGNPQHYGVRTGVGSTDIDYIVVDTVYDKRIGYELAMNGTYIPVVDARTREVLFTPEEYDKIREQMRGISYYDADKFEVADTAFIPAVQEKVENIFGKGNLEESESAKETAEKRKAVERAVEKAMARIGLRVEKEVTGDLTNGFIELIDTGSTGRGTNIPGSGDFDFTLKLDKNIIENPEKLKRLKEELVKELAHPSDEESKIEYTGSGDFRYKKVNLEGLKDPVDIDITFMSKDERVKISTDMSVRERLDGIKESDPEGYKCTVANIILAKEKLKEAKIYKKHGSDGASEYGGFGGVGVENWILQNGGSFVDAMGSFLEASKQAEREARETMPNGKPEELLAEELKRMRDIYPIFDFGQNHRAGRYEHDSFINGITEAGYAQMKTKFRELTQELMPEKTATTLRESFSVDAKQITEGRRMGSIEKLQEDLIQAKEDKQIDVQTQAPSMV